MVAMNCRHLEKSWKIFMDDTADLFLSVFKKSIQRRAFLVEWSENRG
jgi:hypothetical protein